MRRHHSLLPPAAIFAALGALIVSVAAPAMASWASAGSGSASSRGTSVPQVATPTASVSGTTATVSWPAASWSGPALHYVVAKVDSNGSSSLPSGTCGIPTTATSCTTSLDPGAWRFRVTASHAQWSGLASPDSNTVSGLATPTGVAAAALSNSQIRVSWNAVAGASGYEVWRSATAGSGYSLVGSPTSSPLLDSALTPSKTYFYRVRAMAGSSPSAFSAEVSATTLGGQFVDIGATGTNTGIACDDCGTTVTMPFNVTFYGHTSNVLKVSSNGFIAFGNSTAPIGAYSNWNIPSASMPLTIMPLWDDLWVQAPGKIVWQTMGTAPNRQFIVQWNLVGHYGFNNSSPVAFQVIFTEGSKAIQFNYGNVQFGSTAYDYGASATVGINRDGSVAQRHSYNSPVIANGTTLIFSTP